jgi:hypothetical protein
MFARATVPAQHPRTHLRNSSSIAVSSSMGRLGFFSRLNISFASSKSVV